MKKSLLLAILLAGSAQIPAIAQMVQPTRFGLLAADAQGILQLDGQPFEEQIHLERPDYTMVRFEQNDADVIFLRQNQGEECPQKFAIVRVTREGAKGLANLGTCSSTAIVPEIDSQQTIRFSQPEAEGAGIMRYEYDSNGVMTETRDISAPSL